jgi:hypothetical protein
MAAKKQLIFSKKKYIYIISVKYLISYTLCGLIFYFFFASILSIIEGIFGLPKNKNRDGIFV